MNIFYLDENPRKAAQAHYDTHVRKMIVESAQMLSTAHRVLDGYSEVKLNRANRSMTIWTLPDENLNEELYKSTHVNHPCNKWVRESVHNYKYLYDLFVELIEEYHYRFGKAHASERLLPALAKFPKNIPQVEATPFKIATSNDVFIADPVAAYRYYYFYDKSDLKAYTRREAPEWLVSPTVS